MSVITNVPSYCYLDVSSPLSILMKRGEKGANWNVHMSVFFSFFLIRGHVVSVPLECCWWELPQRFTEAIQLSGSGLALTTPASTHWPPDLILFCYWSLGFGHTACPTALSSCASYQWELDFITEKGFAFPFATGFIGPPEGCAHDVARNYSMAVLLVKLRQFQASKQEHPQTVDFGGALKMYF